MFDFLRRKKPAAENTFKVCVERFWSWFASESEQMLAAIDEKRCGDIAEAVSRNVDQLGGGFGWVFGPGEGGARHSFTLTGEGVVERQILAQYWESRAPKLPGWCFYSSRQASLEQPTWEIEMDGETFKPSAFWCSVFVDEQEEKFDITVWHPLFSKLPKDDQFRILFIVLDELFGEFGTQRWLGEIKMADDRLAESMPIAELRDFVNAETSKRDWKLIPPGERVSLFRFGEADEFPRGDVLTWTTTVPSLLHEFFDTKGKPADLLKGSGAEFLFVTIPKEMLPRGGEVDARFEIEEAFDKALKSAQSGTVVGGSLGPNGGYIDVLIFDGSKSVEIIKSVMSQLSMPKDASVFRFCKPRGPKLA